MSAYSMQIRSRYANLEPIRAKKQIEWESVDAEDLAQDLRPSAGVRHGGHGLDVERLGIGTVHGIAGAQQAPVQVLGFPAHAATLRHRGACAQTVSANRRGPERIPRTNRVP